MFLLHNTATFSSTKDRVEFSFGYSVCSVLYSDLAMTFAVNGDSSILTKPVDHCVVTDSIWHQIQANRMSPTMIIPWSTSKQCTVSPWGCFTLLVWLSLTLIHPDTLIHGLWMWTSFLVRPTFTLPLILTVAWDLNRGATYLGPCDEHMLNVAACMSGRQPARGRRSPPHPTLSLPQTRWCSPRLSFCWRRSSLLCPWTGSLSRRWTPTCRRDTHTHTITPVCSPRPPPTTAPQPTIRPAPKARACLAGMSSLCAAIPHASSLPHGDTCARCEMSWRLLWFLHHRHTHKYMESQCTHTQHCLS